MIQYVRYSTYIKQNRNIEICYYFIRFRKCCKIWTGK